MLQLGDVEQLPALNSFYERFENEAGQTQSLRTWLSRQSLNEVIVLVTHQVNIMALSGRSTSSGEMVVLRLEPGGDFTVLGSLPAL